MQFEDRFRAMNTDIDVVVESVSHPSAEFLTLRLLFAQQEQRFSRFIESSLLSRLNRGERIEDPWLAQLMRLALAAHDATGGLFNPMVLPALRQAGYGVSFESISGGDPHPQLLSEPLHAIVLDGESVRLNQGQFDGGGIVKGWTVDLAVEHLLAAGVGGALVNAGGDMRAEGLGDGDHGWLAAVEHPLRPATLAWQGTIRGALTTSTTLKRRWRTATGADAHHLIDPRSGLPAESPFVQVSCRAAEARVAEVWAKAVLIGGEPAIEGATMAGVGVLAVDINGRVQELGFAT